MYSELVRVIAALFKIRFDRLEKNPETILRDIKPPYDYKLPSKYLLLI